MEDPEQREAASMSGILREPAEICDWSNWMVTLSTARHELTLRRGRVEVLGGRVGKTSTGAVRLPPMKEGPEMLSPIGAAMTLPGSVHSPA